MSTSSGQSGKNGEATIPSLVREAADSCVTLVSAHFKIANLELAADLHATARRLSVMLAIGVVAFVGYVLLMVGVGFELGASLGRSLAFGLLGVLHLAAAGVAALVVALKRRRETHVGQVFDSVSQSVATVADAVMSPPSSAPALERPHVGSHVSR